MGNYSNKIWNKDCWDWVLNFGLALENKIDRKIEQMKEEKWKEIKKYYLLHWQKEKGYKLCIYLYLYYRHIDSEKDHKICKNILLHFLLLLFFYIFKLLSWAIEEAALRNTSCLDNTRMSLSRGIIQWINIQN